MYPTIKIYSLTLTAYEFQCLTRTNINAELTVYSIPTEILCRLSMTRLAYFCINNHIPLFVKWNSDVEEQTITFDLFAQPNDKNHIRIIEEELVISKLINKD